MATKRTIDDLNKEGDDKIVETNSSVKNGDILTDDNEASDDINASKRFQQEDFDDWRLV